MSLTSSWIIVKTADERQLDEFVNSLAAVLYITSILGLAHCNASDSSEQAINFNRTAEDLYAGIDDAWVFRASSSISCSILNREMREAAVSRIAEIASASNNCHGQSYTTRTGNGKYGVAQHGIIMQSLYTLLSIAVEVPGQGNSGMLHLMDLISNVKCLGEDSPKTSFKLEIASYIHHQYWTVCIGFKMSYLDKSEPISAEGKLWCCIPSERSQALIGRLRGLGMNLQPLSGERLGLQEGATITDLDIQAAFDEIYSMLNGSYDPAENWEFGCKLLQD